jgi:anti-sigma regulatory factor (Ser/Thr protein kinase)
MATGDTALGSASQHRGLRVLPEVGMVGSWPLQSSLEHAAAPGEVPAARRHVRHILQAWGLPTFSDDTELVVSELVSNAVAISAAIHQAEIRLWVISDGRQVLVLTWDANLDPPETADPAADAENGRGLLLVEALSTRWGWYFAAGLGGKVVWALAAWGSWPGRVPGRSPRGAPARPCSQPSGGPCRMAADDQSRRPR